MIAKAGALAMVVLAMAGQAEATEPSRLSGLYIDVGPAGLLPDTNASIKAAGRPLPNANANASNNVTPGLGIGFFFTPSISVEAWIGVPPTTTLTGSGTLGGLTLGKVTYGPTILVANYHFRQFGAFQPFVGAGLSYTVILATNGSAISNLRVQNGLGAAIRTGFDVMLSDHWGLFASANKVFVSTNVTGSVNRAIPALGGAPVIAHVNFNPLVLFAGVIYRF